MRVVDRDTGEVLSQCPSGLRAFNTAGEIVFLPCSQWKCPYCCRILSWQWATRIRYGIALWPLDAYFWTLTVPGEVYSPDRAFKIVRDGWDNLRKYCQRQMPSFHYASFVEIHPHRAGIAHFHVITLHRCAGRLKDVAHHAGFGYEATEEKVTGWRAALYVAKYTSKQGAGMPKGFRRVRISRQWPKLPELPAENQILILRPAEVLPAYFLRVASVAGISPVLLEERWLDRPGL